LDSIRGHVICARRLESLGLISVTDCMKVMREVDAGAAGDASALSRKKARGRPEDEPEVSPIDTIHTSFAEIQADVGCVAEHFFHSFESSDAGGSEW